MRRIALSAVVCLWVLSGCAQQNKRMTLNLSKGYPKPALTEAQKDELDALLKGAVIHFDFDEATLTPVSLGRLEFLAEALIERPWATIKIAGHCDERGTVEYNLALGMRRAQAARSYLTNLGVPEAAVEVVTFGSELPAVDGTDETAHAANRRDELFPLHVDLLGMLNPQ